MNIEKGSDYNSMKMIKSQMWAVRRKKFYFHMPLREKDSVGSERDTPLPPLESMTKQWKFPLFF